MSEPPAAWWTCSLHPQLFGLGGLLSSHLTVPGSRLSGLSAEAEEPSTSRYLHHLLSFKPTLKHLFHTCISSLSFIISDDLYYFFISNQFISLLYFSLGFILTHLQHFV